jgi:hemerythrin-like metal-binding protein
MALFVWDSKLKTNISVCDEQHQKLIALLNELHEAMISKKDKNLIGNTLDELIEYAVYHFQTEEKLLEQYEFPYLNSHKAEHANFSKEVFDIKKRFDSGETIMTTEVLSFVKNWVNDHIIGTDKNYTTFLRNKGVL